jgi:protein arginine N-methyltransferase 1
MSLIVDEHRHYVSDPVRVRAFERAVAAVVRPGDVVVDLGSGTGILGLLALRAGARHVYSIESTGMIEVARVLASANDLAHRITFLKRHSTEASLPEPADVLVADLVGGMGFEIGLFDIYADARRFLKPDARLIPRSLTMAVAPVEDVECFAETHFWSRTCAGFSMAPVLNWAANTAYPRLLAPGALLSDEVVSVVCEPGRSYSLFRLQGEVSCSRAGEMHGVAGWFEADLAEGVVLSNAPRATERLNRRNVFFPLDRAVAVRPGDRVSVHVRIRPTDLVIGWDVEVRNASGVQRERHSTLDGMLMCREDMRASDPQSHPRLTPRGVARQTVLQLCDGRHALAEIEGEVLRRHAPLFASVADAQAFVAEVVLRYSELNA